MKLIVLAGAKQGTEVPIKKDKFIIGRSRECTLRAGSDAISRHHCAILRSGDDFKIRDLGSRNGTYVNDEKIAEETLLAHGDVVRVGPLTFQCAATADIDRSKKPKVKDVAEAVSRTSQSSAQHDSDVMEDDISRWLLGPEPGSAALNETQNFRIDDTHTMQTSRNSETIEIPVEPEDEAEVVDDAAGKKGKKVVGKLPPLPPKKSAKDSREAAADVLRELNRRR